MVGLHDVAYTISKLLRVYTTSRGPGAWGRHEACPYDTVNLA